jgi:hypothetical protein
MEAHLREHLGEPFYEDERFALFEVSHTSATPEFVALSASETEITREADSYLYAPTPLRAEFRARLRSDGRTVAFYRDGALVARWTVDGELDIDLPVTVEAGYHTLALAIEPPCPPQVPHMLECRAVGLADVSLDVAEERDS